MSLVKERPKRKCAAYHPHEIASSVKPLKYTPPPHRSIIDHPLTDKSAYKTFTLIEKSKPDISLRKITNRKSVNKNHHCYCDGDCSHDCPNRLSFQECDPSKCKSSLCTNMELSYPKVALPSIYIKKTPKKGYGVFAGELIKKGTFIIEYIGELISFPELNRRFEARGAPHTYAFKLDADTIIDAADKGNESRFINHSCDPNCVDELWQVCGENRIKLRARRDIKLGEELTFDYHLTNVDGYEPQKCYCGAKNCCGYMDRAYAAANKKGAIPATKLRSSNNFNRIKTESW